MNKTFKTLVFAAMLMIPFAGFSQQIPRNTQFMVNTYLVNPAVAGTKDYSPFFASFRTQWAGFKGAPTTLMASGHTALPHNLGVGAIFFNDNTGGAISETGAELTGAYHIDLNNFDAISFGLSANISQYKFDNSKLVVYDQNDLALNGGLMESKLNMDATFGFLVYGKQYYFGMSIPQMIQTKLKLLSEVDANDNRNARHFQIMGSYKYIIDDTWDIQPSGLVRFTHSTPVQIDANVRVNYNNNAYLGVTYRVRDAVAFMIGGIYNNFAISYSYDITTTSVRVLSPHTHEIAIGYYLSRKKGAFRSGSLGPRQLDRSKIVN